MSASSSTVAGQRPRAHALDPRAPGLSLRQALLIFTRATSARIISGLLVIALAVRIAVGGFSVWDLVVAATIVAVHPFTEWVIHVGVLHWRPRRLGRFVLDTDLAHKHRLHHVSPHEPEYWYTPMRGALIGFAISALIIWMVSPNVELWLTFLATIFAVGLVYEWTHYLCHTSYRPRGRLYRRLWRLHRLHHFKNEHYWKGVTMHLADWVLGTLPSPRAVPTSPTCRDLLGRDGLR